MTTDLVPNQIKPSEIFVPNGLDIILAGVNTKVSEFNSQEFDLEKTKDRDKIRSFAMQVSKSKTFIDKARLEYVRDKKAALKVIDSEGKRFRDSMDEIKEQVREPLTKWEEVEKARIEAERQFEIYLLEWDEAIAEDAIFNREREIERKESEFKKIEDERIAKEEAERAEKEKAENEARIKKEAEEKAKFNSAEKVKWAKIKRITDLGLVLDEGGKQWDKDDINISVVEFQTLNDGDFDNLIIKIKKEIDRRSKEKAKADQEAAIQKTKDDLAAKAKASRIAEDNQRKEDKRIADKKAANKRHQASVNNKIKDALITCAGLDEETAKKVIVETVQRNIPFLKILY